MSAAALSKETNDFTTYTFPKVGVSAKRKLKQLCRLFPTPRNLITGHLFLFVDVVGLSVSCPLGSDTSELLEGAGLADSLESFESLHVISDSHGASSLDDGFDRHHFSSQLHGLGELLGARVSLPGLLRVDGEEDQLALVLLQTLGVKLQRLNTLVSDRIILAQIKRNIKSLLTSCGDPRQYRWSGRTSC